MAKKNIADNNNNSSAKSNKSNKNNNTKKSNNNGNDFNSKIEEIKSFVNQCKRVLMITRRPSKDEFIMVSKVTGLGICLLGTIGFAIHVPMMYLKAMLKG